MLKSRFAPSPTGYLHIGGARTALYAWLLAKAEKGKFVLRIEDTDRERSTESSIQAIMDAMDWLDLDYDEGPFYQTKRFDRYKEVIQQLLDDGHAYKCSCSKERLETLRETQMQNKAKPRYDGKCRDTGVQENDYVIRFKNPVEGSVVFDDCVRGQIEIQNSELDDLILQRSDGTPTYNLTVVVDDLDMGITHVVRGDDHINNTPRQINILKALKADLPIYAHVPMILGEDGKRLSKRHGAVCVMEYRDEGFLPEAVLNFLVRLGWSHGDQEIFSREEMISLFKLEGINKAPSAMNREKLLWLNQHYMKTLPASDVADVLANYMQDCTLAAGPALDKVVTLLAERCKTLVEMAAAARYFYQDVTEYDEKAVKKFFKENTKEILAEVLTELKALADWNKENISDAIKKVCNKCDVGMGKVAQPIRIAVTGSSVSPSVDATLALLGKDKTIKRVEAAIENI